MTDRSFTRSQSVVQKQQPTWIIFDYFCRKQSSQKTNSTFQDIQSGLHMLHIGKFNMIVKQLNIKLNRQQIISTFQSHSISQVMSYQLFESAINQMNQNDPEVKEKINNFSKKLLNQSKGRLQPSKYSFKITSHSGKIEQEIIDELEERKRKRLSLRLDQEVKKEKQKQVIERKMGIRKRNSSKAQVSGINKVQNQASLQKIAKKQSAISNRFKSLNVSPRNKPQQLYIKSFLGDEQDDEYLNSLYKPKLRQKIANRKSYLINNTKSIVDQINQMQNQKEIRNYATIERENNKKMEIGSKIIKKYKLDQ